MSSNGTPPTQHPVWSELEAHYQKIRNLHLRTLFTDDPHRGELFALEALGINP
jgi:glucose-6-phosphate isomerase